ncbi:signal peptidase I [Georgenia subflava]|uniref:Signal peptidase I n=1 Tax=Georgenia subflava TaxID=1622177 RepID=A0A6N7ELW8_9MICO|nr:signal peptidase I [Georgenia subflava]MPV36244.1 signal peptidase I [Georgenia subflava]
MTVVRMVVRAVLGLVLAAIVLLALGIVVLPRVLGWAPVTILTGSMEPAIPTGSQVVLELVEGDEDASELRVGDVITYLPYPDDPTLVTHRIVGITQGPEGHVFTTRGDANDVADPWEITVEQVRGHVRYHLPYAGYLANALDGDQKSAGITAGAVALFGYAAYLVVSGIRLRRQEVAGRARREVERATAERADP